MHLGHNLNATTPTSVITGLVCRALTVGVENRHHMYRVLNTVCRGTRGGSRLSFINFRGLFKSVNLKTSATSDLPICIRLIEFNDSSTMTAWTI